MSSQEKLQPHSFIYTPTFNISTTTAAAVLGKDRNARPASYRFLSPDPDTHAMHARITHDHHKHGRSCPNALVVDDNSAILSCS